MYSTTKSHFTNRTPFVKLSGILLAFIVFYGCTPKKYVDKSHDQEYKKDNKALEVDYLIYHYDDLQSRIYYVIDNKNVIYKKTDSSQAFTASLKLRYKIIPDPDSRIILDSGSFTITDKQVLLKQGSIGGYVSFNCKAGLAAYIELQLKDENRKTENLVQLPIDKQNTFSTQNFLLLQADSAVAVNSHFRSGTNLIVQHNRRAGQKIIVEWYRYNLKLPPPPFSELSYSAPEYRPDSIFEVYPVKNGYPVSLKQTGVYTFKAEPSSAAGCTVFVSDNDFPKVVTHEQMIACTRYILNKEEYKKLMEAADKQKAIEQYWLETGGNSDRARELIRKYYGRVEDANTLFSTAEEGWKTDRGMIYIVFGSPKKVYKTTASETWIYGNEGTPNSVLFKFDKVSNKFTDNDFFLNRSLQYKDPWYMAVGAWREGNILSDN